MQHAIVAGAVGRASCAALRSLHCAPGPRRTQTPPASAQMQQSRETQVEEVERGSSPTFFCVWSKAGQLSFCGGSRPAVQTRLPSHAPHQHCARSQRHAAVFGRRSISPAAGPHDATAAARPGCETRGSAGHSAGRDRASRGMERDDKRSCGKKGVTLRRQWRLFDSDDNNAQSSDWMLCMRAMTRQRNKGSNKKWESKRPTRDVIGNEQNPSLARFLLRLG